MAQQECRSSGDSSSTSKACSAPPLSPKQYCPVSRKTPHGANMRVWALTLQGCSCTRASDAWEPGARRLRPPQGRGVTASSWRKHSTQQPTTEPQQNTHQRLIPASNDGKSCKVRDFEIAASRHSDAAHSRRCLCPSSKQHTAHSHSPLTFSELLPCTFRPTTATEI